jgi:hypothetical protein
MPFITLSSAIYLAVRATVRSLVMLAQVEWNFVRRYVMFVNDFTGDGTLGMGEGAKSFSPLVRYPIRAFLWMLVPIIALFIPMGVVTTTVLALVAIDQATVPDFTVDQWFVTIDSTPDDGKDPSDRDVGIALLTASYGQMEHELNEPYLIGWTVNDKLGMQFWDNRVNRQLGVRHAAIIMNKALAWVTNLGDSDKVDQRIVDANQSGFAIDPELWQFWPIKSAEDFYGDGINSVKSFVADVEAGKPDVTINIINEDKRDIFEAVNDALAVPHGRLIEETDKTQWSKIDDDVFFAKGAAIVARDILVVMKHGFPNEIQRRGATENLDQAILALEKAITFHPWPWTMRGEDDAPFADHRAKLSQYYQDARKRIDNLVQAFRG